jgi:tryptophan halogenase
VLGDDVAAAREWLTGPYRLSAWNEKLGTAPEPPAEDDPKAIRTVGVIGGGTAGYFTALAFKAQRLWLEVSLVESADIPIIGVGEATVSYMVMFLHHYLGIDPAEFYQRVRPTWKLGIKFEWGSRPEGFVAPFGWGSNSAGGHVSLMKYLPFAYHMDNARLVRYLTEMAARRGVRQVDATVAEVRLDGPDRVGDLIAADGCASTSTSTARASAPCWRRRSAPRSRATRAACSPTPPSPAPSRTAATSSRTRRRAR